MISELSRQPGLTVVALGTMLTFGQRHPPPQQLAGDLGVRYVVDGQLDVRGESLHVSVQVVDGRRGTQTWADELTLPVSAWHAAATVVVGRLSRALRLELNDLASQQAPVATSDAEVQARAGRAGLGAALRPCANARHQPARHAAGALGRGLGEIGRAHV